MHQITLGEGSRIARAAGGKVTGAAIARHEEQSVVSVARIVFSHVVREIR